MKEFITEYAGLLVASGLLIAVLVAALLRARRERQADWGTEKPTDLWHSNRVIRREERIPSQDMFSRYGKMSLVDITNLDKRLIPFFVFILVIFLRDRGSWIMLFALGSAVLLLKLTQGRERFCVMGGYLTVQKGRKQKSLRLPALCVLVVSYADYGGGSDKRQGRMLEGRCAVSILSGLSVLQAQERLQKLNRGRCTNTMIQREFKDHFIYSFTYRPELQSTVQRIGCLGWIIPEELKGQVPVDPRRVFVDTAVPKK